MILPNKTESNDSKREKTMQTEFLAKHDFEDFMMAEFNTMSGAPTPAHDRFEAGMLIVNALAEDLALDMAEVDMDDLY